jgi:hypothetical protein
MTEWSGRVVTEARAYWARQLGAGPLPCTRCGRLVYAGEAWDVDHLTERARGGDHGRANQGVAHSLCNRRAGQALAQARTRTRKAKARRVRPW